MCCGPTMLQAIIFFWISEMKAHVELHVVNIVMWPSGFLKDSSFTKMASYSISVCQIWQRYMRRTNWSWSPPLSDTDRPKPHIKSLGLVFSERLSTIMTHFVCGSTSCPWIWFSLTLAADLYLILSVILHNVPACLCLSFLRLSLLSPVCEDHQPRGRWPA